MPHLDGSGQLTAFVKEGAELWEPTNSFGLRWLVLSVLTSAFC